MSLLIRRAAARLWMLPLLPALAMVETLFAIRAGSMAAPEAALSRTLRANDLTRDFALMLR